MTLHEILQAIQTLPEADFRVLRQQVLENPQGVQPTEGTMDVDKLVRVLAEIRAELTDEQLEGIIADMHETYFDDEHEQHGSY